MKTKIISHRGYTKICPDNTLSAFMAALDNKSDAIELDVHFTSDAQLIVHHDYYLGNPDTSEGCIYQRDLAYIKSLTIGEAEKIPTLEEVFARIGNKMAYEIELKGFGKSFIDAVVSLVHRYELAGNIEFTSPHVYNLTCIKKLDTTFRTGLFVAPLPEWMDRELGATLIIN